ncbi:MAG: rhomboid family intramembrane serine protease, partial [Desulfarculaceae bacterium]|nr:rhomboid family intramembrane serine protease [Desulfarculaceae bacterium]
MTDRLNHLTRKEADLAVLVLKSQGIEPYIERTGGMFRVIVEPEETEQAQSILELYYRENRPEEKTNGPPPLPLTWKSATAFCIMGLLALVHFFAIFHGIHQYLIKTYGCSALYILQGSYFRAMTALMLHSDIEHLAGNLAGIFIFGTALFQTAGFGTGSLILLFSGFFGN